MHPRFPLPALLVVLTVATGAPGARAQVTTLLAVEDVTATYSRAVDVTATLSESGTGMPVADAQVVFNLRDSGSTFNIDVGAVNTDSMGRATVRIPLVNGCPLLGTTVLTGGSTAVPVDYVLEASFGGDTLGGTQYTGSTGDATLHLVKERAEVRITLGTSGQLGEVLTIGAQIVDLDGDAPCDRSALTGDRSATIEGHRLAFFWDVNMDGDYSDVRESLGSATTARPAANVDAYASVDVDTAPVNNQPRAGTLDNALQVQLPANDGQYLPAVAVSQLILFPAPVDASRTTLTAEPPTAQAGGSARVEIIVTVRDRFDNALGVDADTHAVKVEIEGDARGAVMDGESATRDPTTGLYKQTMLGASRKGTVTVRASVDGQPGTTLDIEFTGLLPFGPCRCARAPGGMPTAAFAALVAAVLARPRRRQTTHR